METDAVLVGLRLLLRAGPLRLLDGDGADQGADRPTVRLQVLPVRDDTRVLTDLVQPVKK